MAADPSESEARKLAKTIEAYWHQRGFHAVRCVVEKATHGDHDGSAHVVRSNLVNGVPPGATSLTASVRMS